MSVSTDTLRRLTELELSSKQLQGVLAILADMQGADDARRERERNRRARYPRGPSQDGPKDKVVTVTGTVAGASQDGPPSDSLKKESKIPEPRGSGTFGPSQSDLERELFRRGRQVCGKASGGLIASLLKAKQYDVALARAVIETAATKYDPREYVAACLKETPKNDDKSVLSALDKMYPGPGCEGSSPNFLRLSKG